VGCDGLAMSAVSDGRERRDLHAVSAISDLVKGSQPTDGEPEGQMKCHIPHSICTVRSVELNCIRLIFKPPNVSLGFSLLKLNKGRSGA
jgi:hypothetical protein